MTAPRATDAQRWNRELRTAIDAATASGGPLRAEFIRPGGPRGPKGHAVIDSEAEETIRSALLDPFPDYGYLGEETNPSHGSKPSDQPIWVVDPNDGTSAFQAGYRGASISIALIRSGEPVLGVVYAYNYPTDDGDLIAWAEGFPVMRWSPEGCARRGCTPPDVDDLSSCHLWAVASPIDPSLLPMLVSHKADAHPRGNSDLAAPRRYRTAVGIAYRLALVAAGEGSCATTLTAPFAWDMAGGHALLRGAGMDLYTAEGDPVRYDEEGRCTRSAAYFGGDLHVVKETIAKDWGRVFHNDTVERKRDTTIEGVGSVSIETGLPLALSVPSIHREPIPAAILDRVQGTLLGQCVGDSLGSLVEFLSPEEIAARYPVSGGLEERVSAQAPGPFDLADGGTHGTIAGQPTDDTEMALLLGRAIVARGTYDASDARAAYRWWLDSQPFDVGGTIGAALLGNLSPTSQANGALMRVSPLGIFTAGRRWAAHRAGMDTDTTDATVAETVSARWARADAALTHIHENCIAINELFVTAMAAGIVEGLTGPELYEVICERAADAEVPNEVYRWTEEGRTGYTGSFVSQQGWVRIAWQNALYQLIHAKSPGDGIRDTVRRGGDTDTNGAIAGALLGAVFGAAAFPRPWWTTISSARAIEGDPGVTHPRPTVLWPIDWPILSEQLFRCGAERNPSGSI